MPDWDAARYHRLSDPQLAWARTVAARLQPSQGERILDLGCGTGRLTAEIAATPGIMVLPVPERVRFVAGLTGQAAADEPRFTLDYWRLNMSGRRLAS